MPPGRGSIGFAALFQSLQQTHCDPVITMEFNAADDDYVETAGRLWSWWGQHEELPPAQKPGM